MTPNIELLHIDCMEYLAGLPDKAFELAIIDPEYGINAANMVMGKGKNKKWSKKDWDKDVFKETVFNEIERVSVKVIIWGSNYFPFLPVTGGWIFWDKDRRKDVSFSDGEFAWTNFLTTAKKVTIRYDGFIGSDGDKIHPTQKPVKLYRWLLHNYAKPGDKILDTHGGSRSLAIACHQMGFNHVSCEIDLDYHNDSVKRFKEQTMQQDLFKQAV